MPRLPIAFLLLLALTSARATAQLNPHSLVHYNELDGNIIFDVMPDRMGNIWLATQNGLVKYNGYEYERFFANPNDSSSINSVLTTSLLEDEKGNIWVGCVDDINVYNPQKSSFRHFRFDTLTDFPPGSQSVINRMVSAGNGRIWFSVTSNFGRVAGHALFYYDARSDSLCRFNYPDGFNLLNVSSMCAGGRSNLWVLSFSGIYRIDSAGSIQRIADPSNAAFPGYSFFNDVACDRNGILWLTSNHGALYSYDPMAVRYKCFPVTVTGGPKSGSPELSRLKIDAGGIIWVGSNQGLIRFDPAIASFSGFSSGPETKLQRAAVNCVAADLFGNIWAGTPNNGLLKYNDQTEFKSFVYNKDDKSSILQGWAGFITQSDDDKVYVATLGGNPDLSGITVYDPASQTITNRTNNSIDPGLGGIFAIMAEGPDELLIHSNLGICRYNYLTNTIVRNVLPGVPDTAGIFNFHTDSRGNTWVFTSSGVHVHEKVSGRYRLYRLTDIPGNEGSSDEITKASESPRHGLWLQGNNGLYLYDYKTDKVRRLAHDRSKGDVLPSQDINSLYEDPSGIVWVGTWQGGLSRYNVETGEIRTYTTADGLPSMAIQGILADEKNKDLWLSTFNGLSRFNTESGSFTNFGLEDGIQSLLFADGAYLKTNTGLFVFGGSNGITLFNPDEIARNSSTPNVFITGLKIGSRSVPAGDGLVLSYDENTVAINYIAIHYANPAKNAYACRLENYDDEWREVGNQRTTVYYNLPPGEYTFHVKAASSNRVWNEEGASVTFRIKPPWYGTWLAYLIYALLFIGLVAAIDRIQRRRLTERERARTREKELADAREIEKAYNTLKATQAQLVQAEKMASLGELTAGIAHEIQNPLNFINNFSEINVELIEELGEELKAGNTDDALAIAADVAANERKISQHGRRADDIVKAMLQHSRVSTGTREPADLNAICDEFFRLAYHGLRAKDKSFNAKLTADFDPQVGKVAVIPQDFGRVILNLLTNAFYAVKQKALEGVIGYEPEVAVSTSRRAGVVEIRVKDNGGGIPQRILDKIFQPFFTTKPTGEGTGLGLSLAYDIITKGHGGELRVETAEGEGTEFIIILHDKNVQ